MATTETLTSLAMLKVKIDHGQDYLDYLYPFVVQVLTDNRPERVTDTGVRDLLRSQCGLEIPTRAVQVVLNRIAKKGLLQREDGVFRIISELPNHGIAHSKSEAERHISAVIEGLIAYSSERNLPELSRAEAVDAICSFLLEFNIPCLRAYLRGTAIPAVANSKPTYIVLVSEYVMYLQKSSPERFESFLVMVQGHMLANALLCPDLRDAPKGYSHVSFFLDTPLLIQLLGLEGEPKRIAAKELIDLIKRLGGSVKAFSHSREELERVIKGAADHVDSPRGRGAIVFEARRSGRTKSDFLLLAGKFEEVLETEIEFKRTPPYSPDFQISETAFEQLLDEEISYFNPRAREYDINSVRSIYVLRGNAAPFSLEKSKAVLVTSNLAFSRAAFDYGKFHQSSKEVSSVITDFSLANMAWLKAPMGAPNIPMAELIAHAYAALRPTKAILDKFLREIDRLQSVGELTPRDHQLLRASTVAHDELMELTLGDESSLTTETVTETLRRVTESIKAEESEKLVEEATAHTDTRTILEGERAKSSALKKRIYWICRRRSYWGANAVFIPIAILILFGVYAGLSAKEHAPLLGWLLFAGAIVVAALTPLNLFFGTTVAALRDKLQTKILKWLLRREAKITGIALE